MGYQALGLTLTTTRSLACTDLQTTLKRTGIVVATTVMLPGATRSSSTSRELLLRYLRLSLKKAKPLRTSSNLTLILAEAMMLRLCCETQTAQKPCSLECAEYNARCRQMLRKVCQSIPETCEICKTWERLCQTYRLSSTKP